MGLRAIVMNQKQLNELSALRRQKREWELQRATLVSEQAYMETKVKDLGVAFVKQCFELEETKHKVNAWEKAQTAESWILPDSVRNAYSAKYEWDSYDEADSKGLDYPTDQNE